MTSRERRAKALVNAMEGPTLPFDGATFWVFYRYHRCKGRTEYRVGIAYDWNNQPHLLGVKLAEGFPLSGTQLPVVPPEVLQRLTQRLHPETKADFIRKLWNRR